MTQGTLQVQTIHFRTELMLAGAEGVLMRYPWGICVRTPANPTYYFGNYLLLDAAPQSSDVALWTMTFRSLFADEPRVRHVTLQWDDPTDSVDAFVAYADAGFELEETITLVAPPAVAMAHGREPRLPSKLRALSTDADWNAACDLAVELRGDDFEESRYRAYKIDQMAWYRRLSEHGLGNWFGAFVDGRLVADLGLFGNGHVFRYQNVETHPDFRRQGLCDALVRYAARVQVPQGCEAAGTNLASAHVVISADAHYHALDLYRKIGFVDTERHVSVCLYPETR
jgi:GNAT superfamily N-acetyltransferase